MNSNNLKQKSFSRPVNPVKSSVPPVLINNNSNKNSIPTKPSKTVNLASNGSKIAKPSKSISERIDTIVCIIWFVGSALGVGVFWYHTIGGFDFSVIFVTVMMTLGSICGFISGISDRDGVILKYIPGILYAAGGLIISFIGSVVILLPIYIIGGLCGWWSL